MNIRILSSDDLASFKSLRARGLRETPEAFGSTYEEFQQLSKEELLELLGPQGDPLENFVMGAFDGEGTLLGIAGLKRDSVLKSRHRALLWGMYVNPDERGQGTGKKVLWAVLEQARALPHLEQIHLTVVTSCVAARRMYMSVGFRSYGIEPRAMKYNDTYFDEDLMVCQLY